jgi:hypothetical protein
MRYIISVANYVTHVTAAQALGRSRRGDVLGKRRQQKQDWRGSAGRKVLTVSQLPSVIISHYQCYELGTPVRHATFAGVHGARC